MIQLSEQQIIDEVAHRLAGRHAHVEPVHVARIVHEEYARFDTSPIRDFIPLFVERNATKQLTKLSGEELSTPGV